MVEEKITGYPSIDKPWLKGYSDVTYRMEKYNQIIDGIKAVWNDEEECIINYYDTEIKAGDFFNRTDLVARALTAIGIKKGILL